MLSADVPTNTVIFPAFNTCVLPSRHAAPLLLHNVGLSVCAALPHTLTQQHPQPQPQPQQVLINTGILVAYCSAIPYELGFTGMDVAGGVWCSWWRIMLGAGLLPATLQVCLLDI